MLWVTNDTVRIPSADAIRASIGSASSSIPRRVDG